MTTTQCPHHWIIETSHGSTSKGVCRLCGEERDFANSPDNVRTSTTTGKSIIPYNEQVLVFSESGELLGAARLLGEARRSGQKLDWNWTAKLRDTSFEPNILRQSGRLRLVFNDGVEGFAFCANPSWTSRRGWNLSLIGDGMPPRAET